MKAPKYVNYPDHMCIMDNVTPGVPGNMSQVHNVRDRDDDTFGAQNDSMDSIHNDDTMSMKIWFWIPTTFSTSSSNGTVTYAMNKGIP